MKTVQWLAAALLLLSLAACGGAPSAAVATPSPATFDRRAMLENLATQLVLPTHETFLTALEELDAATRAFSADPTPATLDAAQSAWLRANLARMTVLPYNFDWVADSLIHNRIDARPPRVAFINDEILAGDMAITTAYLDSIGSSSVGLGVMEYLLFDPAGDDEAILSAFTASEDATRRRELLVGLAAALPPRAVELLSVWSADGENYTQIFIDADAAGGDIYGSINLLTNHMIAVIEEIVGDRLGKPLGKRTNGQVRPELVEAPYSGASLERIIATVEALQTTFNGGDGLGFDDYLDFLNAAYGEIPLSQAVNEQFDASLAALRAIDGPLETAVTSNPAQVEAAYEALRQLLAMFKADLVSQMGLTMTFNDSDGD
jgi:predicted lipoprotein